MFPSSATFRVGNLPLNSTYGRGLFESQRSFTANGVRQAGSLIGVRGNFAGTDQARAVGDVCSAWFFSTRLAAWAIVSS